MVEADPLAVAERLQQAAAHEDERCCGKFCTRIHRFGQVDAVWGSPEAFARVAVPVVLRAYADSLPKDAFDRARWLTGIHGSLPTTIPLVMAERVLGDVRVYLRAMADEVEALGAAP